MSLVQSLFPNTSNGSGLKIQPWLVVGTTLVQQFQTHQNVLLSVHISGLPSQGEHERGLVSGTLTLLLQRLTPGAMAGGSAGTAFFFTCRHHSVGLKSHSSDTRWMISSKKIALHGTVGGGNVTVASQCGSTKGLVFISQAVAQRRLVPGPVAPPGD